MGTPARPTNPAGLEPTQAISPGANPWEARSVGRSESAMVDPAVAAGAEFVAADQLRPTTFVSWPPSDSSVTNKPLHPGASSMSTGNTENTENTANTANTENTENTSALITLGTQGQTVADPAQDVRGRRVHDSNGADIGKITDLLIDTEDRKVRFLEVEHGGFFGLGAKTSFIPVDAISAVADHVVSIHQSGEHVAAAPPYDPELQDRTSYYEHLSDYYGYRPYWGAGYVYPGYPYYSNGSRHGGNTFQPGN
jgi:sporulation protein YlmC with PRC-barrel domain